MSNSVPIDYRVKSIIVCGVTNEGVQQDPSGAIHAAMQSIKVDSKFCSKMRITMNPEVTKCSVTLTSNILWIAKSVKYEVTDFGGGCWGMTHRPIDQQYIDCSQALTCTAVLKQGRISYADPLQETLRVFQDVKARRLEHGPDGQINLVPTHPQKPRSMFDRAFAGYALHLYNHPIAVYDPNSSQPVRLVQFKTRDAMLNCLPQGRVLAL